MKVLTAAPYWVDNISQVVEVSPGAACEGGFLIPRNSALAVTAMQPEREPTLRERHPRLFATETWRDLYKDRRRTCPHCGSYVWLDLDRGGYEHLVCSACGWEE